MSDTKHTSRPWKLMPSSEEGAHSKRIFAGTQYIATVGGSDQKWDEIVANGMLMAASPALLDALRPFARFACDEPHIGEHKCHNCIARDAIYEATGEDCKHNWLR